MSIADHPVALKIAVLLAHLVLAVHPAYCVLVIVVAAGCFGRLRVQDFAFVSAPVSLSVGVVDSVARINTEVNCQWRRRSRRRWRCNRFASSSCAVNLVSAVTRATAAV